MDGTAWRIVSVGPSGTLDQDVLLFEQE